MKNTNPENGDSCAFPYVIPETDSSFEVEPGLTKREFFAAFAMAGLMVNSEIFPVADLVAESVITADRLLSELAKPIDQ